MSTVTPMMNLGVLISQVEYCVARMARSSGVTLTCHGFAMSELIGYGNRTLLNGNGEISFCQRPAKHAKRGACRDRRGRMPGVFESADRAVRQAEVETKRAATWRLPSITSI
jgi:hypothetical protein